MVAPGTYHGQVELARRGSRVTRTVREAVRGLFDQSQPFGRLALVHTIFSAGSTLVTVSLAGSLFFSVSPSESKSKVLLYLLLTIAPFAIVAPALSPLLDRGVTARRASIAVASGGSAVLAVSMSDHLKGLLLFPEAFGILVLSKLYLVAKAALIPTMTGGDDLASANAKLAVLAGLAGFAASAVGVAFLQIGAPWVLRIDFVVFLAGAIGAARLPRATVLSTAPAPVGETEDGRPLHGPSVPAPLPVPETLPGGPGGLIYGRRTRGGGASSTADPGSPRRMNVREERKRLGLPLLVPEVTIGLLGMTVLRGAFGFMTFFLAFALRADKAPTWWYGFLLLASGAGGLAGSTLVPLLRKRLSEQQIIALSLVFTAIAALLAGWGGSLYEQPLVALAVGCTSTGAKPAFDSIGQRYVPPAALGRAFARFETQLQLVWVVCALVAVVISFSFRAGDVLIAVACAVAAVFHFSLRRSLARQDDPFRARRSRPRRQAA